MCSLSMNHRRPLHSLLELRPPFTAKSSPSIINSLSAVRFPMGHGYLLLMWVEDFNTLNPQTGMEAGMRANFGGEEGRPQIH
ncbi:hypothetical protein LguiA_017350 [Lonicera macranthoides]